MAPDTWAEQFECLERINAIRETNQVLTRITHVNGWSTAVYMSYMSQHYLPFVLRVEFIHWVLNCRFFCSCIRVQCVTVCQFGDSRVHSCRGSSAKSTYSYLTARWSVAAELPDDLERPRLTTEWDFRGKLRSAFSAGAADGGFLLLWRQRNDASTGSDWQCTLYLLCSSHSDSPPQQPAVPSQRPATAPMR